ncbi:hypothetical protein N803_14470 [Knoellia subterranea KCTC 19937]|uniref:Uncharacterized protein n=2 Tax=Knoellia TaxID=136099 RepID=A0A0A0JKK1_9MICO|nr:hypothetical protein N803_14470 [Knoellia subterranea KCTC 19937]
MPDGRDDGEIQASVGSEGELSELQPDAEGAEQTVIAEVAPGVAVVFGPPPLDLELVDTGFVTSADLTQLSNVLSAMANTATVAGNVGQALSTLQGLYRVNDATQALLASGAKLAVKDGANLGTMLTSEGLKQARFIPVTGLTAAQTAAAIGPAVATIALQIQLSEISSLVKTNVVLTRQVHEGLERDQRAELAGLVATIDRAIARAKELESVPTSLWDTVAGSEAALWKQQELHRDKVRHHVQQIGSEDPRARSDYLRFNAQSIALDTTALLSSLKAWTGLQALHAGKARTAGRDDPDEQRLVEVIARDTRTEVESSMIEIKTLTDALTRELRLVANLPGRQTLSQSLPRARSEAKAARGTAASLLKSVSPLAEALHPPPPPLSPPRVICIEDGVDLAPFLRVLRWFLDDDEVIQAMGMSEREPAGRVVAEAIGKARERLAAARDRMVSRTLVVLTDRRLLTADSDAFLEEGAISHDFPMEHIRYVRRTTAGTSDEPSLVDLTTRDADVHLRFTTAASVQINALVSLLAQAMNLPELERSALLEGGSVEREGQQIAGSGEPPEPFAAEEGSSLGE